MTLCNMAVECAAWTGIVAPDDALINDIQGRPFAPTGEIWERAVQDWLDLRSDDAHLPVTSPARRHRQMAELTI